MKRFSFSGLNTIYFWISALLLYLPILLLIIFSFNNSTFLIFPLKGFTLKWYSQLMDASELLRSLENSLLVGLASSLLSTILGAMGALALTRFEFKGKTPF